MALTFGGAATDVLNLGSGSSLDDLDPFTYLYWLNPTTLTGGRLLFRKAGSGIKLLQISGTGGDVALQVQRGGGFTNYTTSSTPLSATGSWIFLAGTYSSAAAAGQVHNIYKGTLTAAATECTYGTATDSSGSTLADAAGDLNIGGRAGQSVAFQGAIAVCAVFNRELTLGEILSWQFDPRVLSGCVAFHHLGFNGASTQVDYSGRLNAGTVTGATASAHVPLKRPFLRRINYVPVAAGGGGSATVLPGVGVLTVTGFAPTVVTPQTVLPGVGAATVDGFAPTIATPQTLTPGVGALTVAGFSPTIVTPQVVFPGVGAATLDGFAPTIVTPQSVTPSVGVLTLGGFAPTILIGAGASPAVGELTFTGFAPTILAAVSVLPGVGAVLLTGYEPTVLASTPVADNTDSGLARDRSPIVSRLDRSPLVRAKDRSPLIDVFDRSPLVAVYGRDETIRAKNREPLA